MQLPTFQELIHNKKLLYHFHTKAVIYSKVPLVTYINSFFKLEWLIHSLAKDPWKFLSFL